MRSMIGKICGGMGVVECGLAVGMAGMFSQGKRPFHVLAKPAGALCNLGCEYCFYLKKAGMFYGGSFRMSEETMVSFIRGYIEAHAEGDEVMFAWQGGEPTLLGVGFYRRVVELQRTWAQGRRVRNALQTNGTLLDAEWGEFLRAENFLVGVSVDGPEELHDRFRTDKGGGATWRRVMRGVEVLRRHGVEWNVLTVVSAANVERPREVYRFLRGLGTRHVQFIPLVERAGADEADLSAVPMSAEVSPQTAGAEAYGEFMCAVFDEWLRRDVGRVFVQAFEGALAQRMGLGAAVCVHAEVCGRALAIEHNGDVFSCDHYVYAENRLGNVREQTLEALVNSPQQVMFGRAKASGLPEACRSCDVWWLCHGGCPKHRLARTATGEPGLNYLCAGYRKFFLHIGPALDRMVGLLASGRKVSEVMTWARARKGGG